MFINPRLSTTPPSEKGKEIDRTAETVNPTSEKIQNTVQSNISQGEADSTPAKGLVSRLWGWWKGEPKSETDQNVEDKGFISRVQEMVAGVNQVRQKDGTAAAIVYSVINPYADGLKADEKIRDAELKINNLLKEDPQAIQFYVFAKDIVTQAFNKKVENSAQQLESRPSLAGLLNKNKELLNGLVQVNFAKGFASLVEKTQAAGEKGEIPNYTDQTFLVNLLALINQNAGKHIDKAKLAEIEKRYQEQVIYFAEDNDAEVLKDMNAKLTSTQQGILQQAIDSYKKDMRTFVNILNAPAEMSRGTQALLEDALEIMVDEQKKPAFKRRFASNPNDEELIKEIHKEIPPSHQKFLQQAIASYKQDKINALDPVAIRPQTLQLLNEALDEAIKFKSINEYEKEIFINQLFGNPEQEMFIDLDGQERYNIGLYGSLGMKELLKAQRDAEMKPMFVAVAGEMMNLLFSEGMDKDLEMMPFLKSIAKALTYVGFFHTEDVREAQATSGSMLHAVVKDVLADFFLKSYVPIHEAMSKQGEWEKVIQDRMEGHEKPSDMIQASTLVFNQIANRYLETTLGRKDATETVVRGLNTALGEKTASLKGKEKEGEMAEEAKQDLAQWLIRSAQEFLNSKDPAFATSLGYVKDITRALTLGLWAQGAVAVMPEIGEGKTLSGELTNKVRQLLSTPEFNEQSTDEAAQKIVGSLLSDVFGIRSKEDLPGMPTYLQSFLYKSISEQMNVRLKPVVVAMIDRERKRQVLKDRTGSDFFGQLCESLSKDILGIAPLYMNSYTAIAQDLYEQVTDKEKIEEADDAIIKAFTQEIAQLMEASKYKPGTRPTRLTKEALMQAFERASGIAVSQDVSGPFEQAFVQIKNIKFSPEQIAKTIVTKVPGLELAEAGIVEKLHDLVQGNGEINQYAHEVLEQYVEGVLLSVVTNFVNKNTPEAGVQALPTDIIALAARKLIDKSKAAYAQAQSNPANNVEQIAQAVTDEILREVVGIESADSLKDLPAPLNEVAYKLIKGQLSEIITSVAQSISTLKNDQQGVKNAAENLEKRLGTNATRIVAHDIAKKVLAETPPLLDEVIGGRKKGTAVIADPIREKLEGLKQAEVQVAKVLLEHAQESVGLRQLLDEQIGDLGHLPKQEKEIATELFGNLVLELMNNGISQLLDVEEAKKAKLSQTLFTGLIQTSADHLKLINQAKVKAAKRGAKDYTTDDLRDILGDKAPKGLLDLEPNYVDSITALSSRSGIALRSNQMHQLKAALRELVKNHGVKPIENEDIICEFKKILGEEVQVNEDALRQESATLKPLRQIVLDEANAPKKLTTIDVYADISEKFMEVIFPKGPDSLDFVPVGTRDFVYNMVKQDLLPTVLPIILESILDKDLITKIVINTLEVARNTLKDDIKVDLNVSAVPQTPNTGLNKALGELVLQVVDLTKLPKPLQLALKNSDGEIRQGLISAIGSSVQAQLGDNFMQEKLKLAMDKLGVRKPGTDESNVLAPDPRSLQQQREAKISERPAQKAKLHQVAKETVDASVAFGLRKPYANAKAAWYKKIDSLLNKIGQSNNKLLRGFLKGAIQVVWLKLVQAFYGMLQLTYSLALRHAVYKFIAIDKNLDLMMDVFIKPSVDQPTPKKEEENFALSSKLLAISLMESAKETFEKLVKEDAQAQA